MLDHQAQRRGFHPPLRMNPHELSRRPKTRLDWPTLTPKSSIGYCLPHLIFGIIEPSSSRAVRGPRLPTCSEDAMKRLFSLFALVALLVSIQATAQVPRTPLIEMGSATW